MALMAKGGSTSKTNLLRLSGIIFGIMGSLHIARYFGWWLLRIGSFELTYLGSLFIGVLLVMLSVACFRNSK